MIEWYRRRLGSLSRRYFVARVLHRLRVRGKGLLHQVIPARPPVPRWAEGWSLDRALATEGVPGTWLGPRAQTLGELRRYVAELPAAEGTLREEVDLLAAGRMRLPLAGIVEFDPARDWHRDPVAGTEWPRIYGRSLDLARPVRGRDPKVLWHAGRMHHVLHLAVAYALGDARAARILADHLEGFRRVNPFPLGLHWSSPMEAAIRAINVLGALHLAGDAISRERRAAWMDLLYAHAVFIEENLEDNEPLGGVNGNHLIVDLVGLIALGVALPCFDRSAQWVGRASALLARELRRQVTPEGMDYENSVGYHRFVLEAFILAATLARNAGVPFEPATLAILTRMTDWLAAVVRPDGTLPLLGDFDGGRVFVPFPAGEDDASGVIASASAFTGRGREPRPALEVFEEAGVVVARAPKSHVVCSAWGVGLKGTGAHSHADAGGFDLWGEGVPLIVDPGTYVYSADLDARNWFRATAAHNTVTVDGRELVEWDPVQLFVAKGYLRPALRRLQEPGAAWEVELLPALDPASGLRLARRYCLHGGALEIHDRFEGPGSHRMEAWLHFSPGTLACAAPGDWGFTKDGVELRVQMGGEVACTAEVGWVSRAYGERTSAPVLHLSREGCLPLEWRIHLTWTQRQRQTG